MSEQETQQSQKQTTTHYWGYRELDASEIKHVAGGDDGGGDGGGGDAGGDGGSSDSGNAGSSDAGGLGGESDAHGDGCDFASSYVHAGEQPDLYWPISTAMNTATNTANPWTFAWDGLY